MQKRISEDCLLETINNDNKSMTFYTRNYYDYADELFRRLVTAHDIKKLVQIEFQPGIHCDMYECPHCYGQGQVVMNGLIRAETYIKVLDEVEGIVPLIQLSGIATEPTTHPDIVEIVKAIKERKFICGLHTKGHRVNSQLSDLLTDDKHDIESYVTFSLDASNAKDYLKIHGISKGRKGQLGIFSDNLFDIVLNNIKELHKLRKKRNSKLRINIVYLLVKQNYSEDDIQQAIDLLGDYCDVIRFSLPHVRNDGFVPSNFLTENEREVLEQIKVKYKNNPKVRVLTNTRIISHNMSFKHCYAQIFQAVVDKAGYVFPCPQTPLKDYNWLECGNVKDSSFLEILASVKRKKKLLADVDAEMKCRVCDRKDEAINIKLSTIFGNKVPW